MGVTQEQRMEEQMIEGMEEWRDIEAAELIDGKTATEEWRTQQKRRKLIVEDTR